MIHILDFRHSKENEKEFNEIIQGVILHFYENFCESLLEKAVDLSSLYIWIKILDGNYLRENSGLVFRLSDKS